MKPVIYFLIIFFTINSQIIYSQVNSNLFAQTECDEIDFVRNYINVKRVINLSISINNNNLILLNSIDAIDEFDNFKSLSDQNIDSLFPNLTYDFNQYLKTNICKETYSELIKQLKKNLSMNGEPKDIYEKYKSAMKALSEVANLNVDGYTFTSNGSKKIFGLYYLDSTDHRQIINFSETDPQYCLIYSIIKKYHISDIK